MESKNTCVEVFGKRLKELRKSNGYTIEQFADMVGISKSTLGYYENDKRMPDIEILARIADTLNVNADYLIGRTNTTALKGKMKTVCEFTGLSDSAAEYLAQLVKDKDYEKLSIINHLFDELTEDYDFYSYETQNGEEAAAFSAHCSSTLRDVRIRTACGTSLFFYSASVCRLLIITKFLPSPQYLFSVFCRRKSGHLPELP